MSPCKKWRLDPLFEESLEAWPKVPSDSISHPKRPVDPPLAPINNLPCDILLDIFSLICTDPAVHYQFCLAAVCRRWREFVMHQPLLWTRIQVPSPTHHDTLAFFERSKFALIDLTFDSGWCHLYDTVAHHASRLRTLNITTWSSREAALIFDRWSDLQVETPHLETISIFSTQGSKSLLGSVENFPICTPWPGISALRTLILTGVQIHNFPPAPNLKFLELSSLNQTTPQYFQNILNNYPLLETLVIHWFSSWSSLSNDEVQFEVKAPSLRSMAIYNDSKHKKDCACALSFLSVDKLEYLEVGGSCPLFGGRHSILFLQSKGVFLKKVRISSGSIRLADIALLSSLSSSTALEIAGLPKNEEVLLAVLQLKNLESVTLTIWPSWQGRAGYMDLDTFSKIVCRVKPRLGCPTYLLVNEEVNPEVLDILGIHLTLLKSSPIKPGFFTLPSVFSGIDNSDDSDNSNNNPVLYEQDSDDEYLYYPESPDYDGEDSDSLDY